uniref:BY PROTMAP: gi/472581206/gb/EMS18955.1/ C-signal [Rhodosporidium toruloides NP11] gi/647402852/emb/CDR49054.1/ RHTO0S22e02146g1_1 [Rhodosporidium toruloides] n=1 Tax=Rhodotorula toruloides TaxID=5286 RepID=A0A0K3CMX4_RHOTO
MSSFTYLISGASRSLGLGYSRALLASSNNVKVIAGARNPSSADQLQALQKEVGKGRLYILKLDVEDASAVQNAIKELESSGFLEAGGLDALINNAGVAVAPEAPSATKPDLVMQNFTTNLFGVMNLTSACLPLLKKGKGKQIFGVSSICGSLGGFFSDNSLATAYCISKAALNMYLRKLSRELESDGFTVVPYHPGYVKTSVTSGQGELTTEEAVKLAVDNVILKVSKEDNGKFYDYNGKIVPW